MSFGHVLYVHWINDLRSTCIWAWGRGAPGR